MSSPAPRTLPACFVANVTTRPGAIALRMRRADGGYREWTYRQYADDVARCAAGLRALGFGPGQRLVMMLRNRPEFHVLDMAVYFCGGTAVSIYNSSSPEQVAYLVRHSQATIAVADDRELLARFADVRAQGCELRHIGVLGDDVPAGVFGWRALLDHAPIDLAGAAHAVEPSSLATLIYTSGTTGPPKAVMITHENVVFTVGAIEHALAGHPRLAHGFAGIRAVSYLPLAHIAERMCSHYWPALSGHQVTCCPDATQIALYLREVKPQLVFGVPRVWEKLHAAVQAALPAQPERAQPLDAATCKSLRAMLGLDDAIIVLTGAAPIEPELEAWFRAIGVPLSSSYGLSETCGPVTWSPLAIRPGSVGRPLRGVEVRLESDGEVVCRGGNVFNGYFHAPELTDQVLDADGWFHTGDIGTIDADGYLSIVDRKKELIITAGGKNVSPSNLEGALKTLPLVGQACAIGDNRPFVSALIVLDPDAAQAWAARRGIARATLHDLSTNRELIDEVERGVERVMAAFNGAEKVKRIKILDTVWEADSDVMTPTFKLKRRAVVTRHATEIEALYAAASGSRA